MRLFIRALVYTEAMNEKVRAGYEVERKITLGQEDDRGVVLNATPAERLAMVWPMTQSCWALMPGAGDHAQQEFQRHIVSIRRGRGD